MSATDSDSTPDNAAHGGCPAVLCSPVCPRCGRPRTNEGQPSRRWFYACGSYLYEGDRILRDRTDICEAVEALNDAAALLAEIMRDEVNHQDEAEKWLRSYAPQYLADVKAIHGEKGVTP